ncbi:zinc-binding dehydrogenase [Nocardia brasiliensis]|uniref:zinc-dependent alcohol dehydrogenase n=1 Tax=Nocardia brasiliensis TaxID=37326 RepID=UPI00366C3D55
MHAYTMVAPGVIEPCELPMPTCGDDEVLLRTEAVTICSTDVSYYRAHLTPPGWPIVPGHEYVGRAVQVGNRVRGVDLGDRLVYWGQSDFGGLADYRTIRPLLPNQNGETSWYTERNFYDADQAAAVVVPDSLPSRIATLVEPLTSVLRCLLVNPPRPGDVCVVLGCGPSALLAVQVLHRLLGASRIVVLDKDPRRIRMANRMGAEFGFNMSCQTGEVAEFVRRHHDQFADYVLDALPHVAAVGPTEDVRQLAMGLLRPGGTYVLYGATAVPQMINTWLVLAKGLRLQATPFDVRLFSMSRSAHVARTALALVNDGLVEVDSLITRTVLSTDATDVASAFAHYGTDGGLKTSVLFDPQLMAGELRLTEVIPASADNASWS